MNTSQTLRPEERRAASEPQPGPSVTGAQALIESFLREGVDTIFGYPGGAIIPVYDALYDYCDRLRHILTGGKGVIAEMELHERRQVYL